VDSFIEATMRLAYMTVPQQLSQWQSETVVFSTGYVIYRQTDGYGVKDSSFEVIKLMMMKTKAKNLMPQ